MRSLNTLMLCLALLLVGSPAPAQDVTVCVDGEEDGDDCVPTIQAAVDEVCESLALEPPGRLQGEVIMEAGTYQDPVWIGIAPIDCGPDCEALCGRAACYEPVPCGDIRLIGAGSGDDPATTTTIDATVDYSVFVGFDPHFPRPYGGTVELADFNVAGGLVGIFSGNVKDGLTIRNVMVSGVSRGVTAFNSNHVTLQDVVIHDVTGWCVGFLGFLPNRYCSLNDLFQCDDVGAPCPPGPSGEDQGQCMILSPEDIRTHGHLVVDSKFGDCGLGISLQNAEDSVIEGNDFSNVGQGPPPYPFGRGAMDVRPYGGPSSLDLWIGSNSFSGVPVDALTLDGDDIRVDCNDFDDVVGFDIVLNGEDNHVVTDDPGRVDDRGEHNTIIWPCE